ncbi:helix-turn-helix transcriptional regulator [Desmospora profundinema]|uniref:Iron-sulfur cluster biosynthesis transcriptional regulator SufR n=1 Tax=Desmospora profundinema TaxID=1571184 RepID=A0ABU1IR67_9BACL|nr:metalloregulator ArsR/SmtB family transcription factor [Desmospora profundinema]MDR6226240.1 iron-sulfur cluster biosynthesis transcriptional regulator SufR [Desmospora profundinema]
MKQQSSTRNQILTMLKMDAPLTVSQMAERLGITEMAVRRHLNTLERDHLVQSRLLRQSMGRPSSQYELTDQSEGHFPKRYRVFTLDLLEDLEAVDGTEKVKQLFERRRDRLAEQYRHCFSGKTLKERVRVLADLQDQKGYMVKWRQLESREFVLTENNCPIAEVADRYPQACECEMSFFRTMLDADVQRTECKASGDRRCTYRIAEMKGKA